MKKIALLVVMLFGMVSYNQAQKLSKEEVARYDTEVRALLKYLEETLNFIGDTTTTAQEKGIVFSESWSKIFIDDKVQVEDDLDNNRNMPINKDVQAYLKDIDFFFKKAHFDFDIQSIANSTRDDGTVYFKASLSRHLVAQTINDEKVDNIKNRFVEINLDRQKSSLKIASIYTTKINQEEALRNWWNALSGNWKTRLGKDIIPEQLRSRVPADMHQISTAVIDRIVQIDIIQFPFNFHGIGDTTYDTAHFFLNAVIRAEMADRSLDLNPVGNAVITSPAAECPDGQHQGIRRGIEA